VQVVGGTDLGVTVTPAHSLNVT